MRISTRSWPAWVWTSEAYLACCGPMWEMWSILSLMPVSLVKRWPISDSFLSEAGAKLFQHRYEISRDCPHAGGHPGGQDAREAGGGRQELPATDWMHEFTPPRR